MRGVNYYWRVLATGLSFAVFGVGGVLLTLFIFPFISLFSVDPIRRQRRVRQIIHHAFRLFVLMMKVLGIMTLTIKGEEKLEHTRGKLVIANHPSLLDVVILISLMPRTDCIVKQALWNNFFLGGAVRAAGYISNSDPELLLDACRESFDCGNSIIVFPEGTRSIPGVEHPFQRGAANIAVRAEVGVVPVCISCEPPTLTKGEKWYHVPPRAMHYDVVVGDGLSIVSYCQGSESASRQVRQLTRGFESYYRG